MSEENEPDIAADAVIEAFRVFILVNGKRPTLELHNKLLQLLKEVRRQHDTV